MGFNPVILAVGGVLLLLAYWAYSRGRGFERLARRIEESQVTPVARVSPGFVEVKGRARGARDLLTSPMTKRQCVYFHFLVEELIKRGKSSAWRTRVSDQQDCGLLLEDIHQGVIAVNLRAANLMLKPDVHTRSGFLQDAPPDLEETLARYGGSSRGLIFNRTMRYTETVIEAGDELHVLGTAQVQDDRMGIDRGSDLFIVSDQPEEKLTASFRGKRTIRYVLAFVLAVLGLGVSGLSMVAEFLPRR